jgi:histidyl-tRNA synthetase
LFKDELEEQYRLHTTCGVKVVGMIYAVDTTEVSNNHWTASVYTRVEEMLQKTRDICPFQVHIERVFCSPKQIRKQLKIFDKKEIESVVVIGENEMKEGKVKVMKRQDDLGYVADGLCDISLLFNKIL